MKNKIIISGCSYSAYSGFGVSYGDNLKRHGYDVHNMAWNGQSNDSILKKIYDYINNTKVEESLIICQLTFIHRIGWFHNSIKRWVDYQPKYMQTIPQYDIENDSVKFDILMDETFMEDGEWGVPKDIPKDEYIILTEMYKTWLQRVYDEDETFNYLLYKIDTLKTYVESTNNKIEFVYWPDIENKIQLQEMKKRNFFNIDGEYSMLKWSTKNKLVDNTSHLHADGHIIFSNIWNEIIKDKFTNIKKIQKNSFI